MPAGRRRQALALWSREGPVRLTHDTYSFGAGLLGGELVDTPLGGFPRFEH
eukprot:NODE_11907_length_271_cov_1.592593.p3 GENE.NODE_11907_length_271_cov_1.592593~~NODE_11907_length_271_cov_1.592593.p3  ORF type:complete len:58 (-),score=6.43 NODE_11907_length_271_cov_1.592593:96-248(-)